MKNKFIIVFFLFISYISFGQIPVTWQDLSDVKFVDKYFPDYDEHFLYPNFSASIKALEGQKISIKGYFLNIDPTGEIFVVSKGPMSSCFFCGVGGPETAIEVRFASKPDFDTDDIIRVTGTLKLNSDDVEHFNYILVESEAKLVK